MSMKDFVILSKIGKLQLIYFHTFLKETEPTAKCTKLSDFQMECNTL